MRRLAFRSMSVVALLGLSLSLLGAPSTARSLRKDWSYVVDFSNTGGRLDKYNPADAALLKMLSPERIKDPTERVAFQRQLDGLIAAQQAARQQGATDDQARSIPSPYGVQTIDPGCQLSSSNPGGYDLCGYYANGDLMSVWEGGQRGQYMYAGLQECDGAGGCPANNNWRVWYKSQAFGFSSNNVSHDVDVAQWEKWYFNQDPGNEVEFRMGTADPAQLNNCAPCYDTGVWNSYLGDPDNGWYTFGEWYIRDYAHIDGTDNTTGVDNYIASYWWDRPGGFILCDGPHNGDHPDPNCYS